MKHTISSMAKQTVTDFPDADPYTLRAHLIIRLSAMGLTISETGAKKAIQTALDRKNGITHPRGGARAGAGRKTNEYYIKLNKQLKDIE